MYVTDVEIYSDQSNLAVMRHPGRKFPGSLIQGDTLFTLFRHAEEIRSFLKDRGLYDRYGPAAELWKALSTRLDHYEEVLTEAGIEVPFNRP